MGTVPGGGGKKQPARAKCKFATQGQSICYDARVGNGYPGRLGERTFFR